jgi:site-specific DNA-methyltransferase (adenine-specific)
MTINIHLGDAIDGLDKQQSESIDCIVTSPPYKDSDGYTESLMRHVFEAAFYTMKKDSLLFVNFGHLVEDKMRPFRVASIIAECGFKLQETFTWVKNHYRPIQGKRRVNNLTEFIFMFSKGDMPELDRLAVGIPYADKSNVGRYAVADLKCGGNVWYIDYDTIQSSDDKLHNDRFPLDLPLRCLKLAGIKPGQLVCDPFTGSGTTALACKQLGLNYVGWEINKTHYETALKRVAND